MFAGTFSVCLTLATAVAAEPVVYRVQLERPGDTSVAVRLTLPQGPHGPLTLVMPRAVPMGYAQQPYDRFVAGVAGHGSDGAPLAVEREDGPRWRVGAAGNVVRSLEYRVDLARMEREILGAADTSSARPTYVGLLGYSAFAYVEGWEDRPVRLEVRAPPGWPVFTTLAPRAPPTLARVEAEAPDFYALADSQVAMGSELKVQRVPCRVPLYLAAYAEGRVDLPLVGRLAGEAMEALVGYFGGAPFAHYTVLLELLEPVTPDHEYGFSMEHLSSSHYFLAPDTGTSAVYPDPDRRRVLFNFAHHVAHAWIPKRSFGEGYYPFSWELAPLIDTIWLSEGFARYVALESLADRMPESEGAAYRRAMLEALSGTVARMPAFLREMPLVELSRIASTRYSEDFRTGRTLFSRGALLAARLDERIRQDSAGTRRLRDALRHLVEWSAASGRGFRVDELPGLFREATGVETRDVWEDALR